MDEDLKKRFEAAYDDYSDSIFRYCFVKSRDRQVALDITQEAFVRTWTYMQRKGAIDDMRPFLYRVARNLWYDHVQKDKRLTSLDVLVDAGWQTPAKEEADAEAHTREAQEIIIKKLEELDDGDRDILVLRYIEEMDIGEIAKIIGKTENATSVHIHRAKKKLESLLTEHYE